MEDKYILSTKTYEDWRNYLLVNSFFFEMLVKHLREQLGIPREGLGSIDSIHNWELEKMAIVRKELVRTEIGNKSGTRKLIEHFALEDQVRRKLYASIFEIIEKFSDLNMSYILILDFVLGYTGMSFTGSSRVSMVTSPNDPLRETGVYIKYTPELSDKDLVTLKKFANESYQTLFKVRHDSKIKKDKSGKDYVKAEKMKFPSRKTDAPTPEQLEIYLEAEKILLEMYKDKPTYIKMPMVFEQVASNLKMSAGKIQRVYYGVLKNFLLPTSVDTKHIFR